jgi:RHS repeat-associated protein
MRSRRVERSSGSSRAVVVVLVLGLVASGSVAALSQEAVSGIAAEAMTPVDPLAPQDHAAAPVDGLQYADPTEALAIIDPPDANAKGTATASYALDVPPGHAITPELAVTYDSSGGNGWMGLGWDLAVSEIAVDTTFGAPHFDPTRESESYTHDGNLLVPNAVGDAWVPRVNQTRRDYTHQVETEYAEIIRHVVGNGGPDDYFWEVRGKDGGVRWYGATPDSGGPAPSTTSSVPTIDERAVVRDGDGNIVRWLLSAERDIGVNLVRYEWETVQYTFASGRWTVVGSCNSNAAVCGQHTYLDRILYTDATSAISDFNGPPYEIDLIRESELATASTAVRSDPIVDGRLGYLDVVADRLARVEVKHGAPPSSGSTRTYDEIAARYSFAYTTGWFGKTLLSTITQGVDDLHVHTLTYHNELGTTVNADTAGFGTTADWTSPNDVTAEVYLDRKANVSALGGSETNAGSGNLYIGFNPVTPSKTGSFGAGVEFSGGDTEALAEWIDLDGDGLPDKVFTSGSSVKFRLNTSGPSGAGLATGDAPTATALPGLSENSNFGFQISFEAYPIVALGVGTGLSFSWAGSYFSDVNADGLVDFVSGGQVYFNRLVDGIPTFSTSSADTPVPLDPSPLPVLSSEELDEIDELFAIQSPPIDTIRRFTAPFAGDVQIDAAVSLDGEGLATTDGVRVAIQHEGAELSSAVLTGSSPSAFGDPITRTVAAGDQLYFRVGAVEDGVADRVAWAPVVTYTDPSPSEDANGRSQVAYDAAEDFTLAGRPDDVLVAPFSGTVRIDATIDLVQALTDDVSLVVVRHDASLAADDRVVTSPTVIPVTGGALVAGTTGETTLSVTVDVEVDDADTGEDLDGDGANDVVTLADRLEVYLAADSPVDLGAIDWAATITYDAATDAAGTPLDVAPGGNPIFEHHVRPHVEFYPGADPQRPAEATDLPDEFTVVLQLDAIADEPGDATAVVTFKNANGTVKSSHDLTDGGEVEFDVDLSDIAGEPYFVDVSVRDGRFTSEGLGLDRFDRYTDDAKTEHTPIAGTLRWVGRQGIFPLAYRGWAVAGYTAAGDLATSAIDRAAFELEADVDAELSEPDRDDLSLAEPTAQPSYAFLSAPVSDGGTTGEPVATDRWVGPRGSIHADADAMQTSRLVADFASLASLQGAASGSGGRSAPTRLGIGGPGLTLMFGAGPFGASAGLSPSWGITDFEDLNGDGYPDVVSAGQVSYTDQRGAYLGARGVAGTSVTNQDLTFSVNGGLSSGMVDIVPNPKGTTNATHGSSAGKGSSASDAGPSFSLGVSGSGGFSWTSPNASGPGDDTPSTSTYGDQQTSLEADANSDDVAIQRAFADVNGDGLADKVYTTAAGVFVQYNLGYGFTEKAVQLGTGGFESRESATGGAGLAFSLPYGEFGGGVNFLWNYDWSRYSWRDVNGDGILDRLHRIGENDVKVAFGTGSGLLAPIDYGDVADVELDGLTTSGQHVAFDRSSGIGGGVSATFYVGPLCLAACYLVIGGGGGYNNSRSSTSADIQDVDGDGFADVVKSLDDTLLQVSSNQQGRTNLLRSVSNPLGGSFTLDYERDGNTTDHPGSVWFMDEVVVDDGRSGDGVDVTTRTFAYDGLDYDRVHRASLGYAEVTTTEVATDGTPLRVTEQTYLNDDVFVAGLLTGVTTLDPAGAAVRGSTVTWGFRDVRAIGSGFDPQDRVTPVVLGDLGQTTTVASRGRSIAPMVTEHAEYWYDGAARTFERVIAYTYDGLGNVLVERDLGAGDDRSDDLITTVEYTDCDTSSTKGCLPTSAHASPLASPKTCVNWASLPGRVVVQQAGSGATPVTLRERSGFEALCDNGVVTEQKVVVDRDGNVAVTDMTVNPYGDHELVMSPPGVDGERYTVRYTYDADRHSDIARVEEFDVAAADAASVLASGPDPSRDQVGITSSATFDPLSGRAASRTDGNGATRHYGYDEFGRLVGISKMAVGGATPTGLITFEYNANDGAYAHAIARHVDDFDGNVPGGGNDAVGLDSTATIDTITFVDGLGRVTQTKRDARMVAPGTSAPANRRQVTGSVSFDALGRPVIDYGPVADDGPAGSFSAAAFDGKQTTTAYDLVDRVTGVTEPGERTTSYDHSFTRPASTDPLLLTVVSTDPEARKVTRGADIRGSQRIHVDTPAPRTDASGATIAPPAPLVTRYDVNALGETLRVVDSAGATTSFAFDLVGNLLAVSTPNQGQTTFAWDLAGRRIERVNEQMRSTGTRVAYGYDLNRLVAVDNPGTVDDVTYEYGRSNADGRFTAGRVRSSSDRSRLTDNSYDATGALSRQRVEVKRHNWRPSLTEEQREGFRWTTDWSYDELGRIASVRYPDAKTVGLVPTPVSVASLTEPGQLVALIEQVDLPGELVTYDYDSGGMVREVRGVEAGVQRVEEPIDRVVDGVQSTIMVPRPTDHAYDYLQERVYDHRFLKVEDAMGNGTTTTRVFDPDTWWLEQQSTTSVDPDPAVTAETQIQDLAYTYDAVGRPLTYRNDLPYANRAINGGAAAQRYEYDGFGRMVAASGTFSLKAREEQRYEYGVGYTPAAPWNLSSKAQTDRLVTTKPNGSPGTTKITEATTYSFDRTLGTPAGPLHVVTDERTDAGGVTTTYDYRYTDNGAIASMLARRAPSPSGSPGKGRSGEPSETNVWDRAFTWNQLDQLTSAGDGSALRTFAYDDVGTLTIQDGNLLDDDGRVLANHGGGPETIFLNQWVTIRAQKIYKHVWAGDDRLLVQMDADGNYESKQLYGHEDLVGSTNIVTDVQGRGFQRHEYLPSGEIWIDDHKEQIRTPFQFAGGYYEDEFALVLFGTRWYDTERELFLSPDPVLVEEVGALIDQPALGGAYTYAGANGVGNVDPSGRTFFSGHQRAEIVRKAELELEIDILIMQLLGQDDEAQAAMDKRDRRSKVKERAKLLETNALVIIDLQKQEVSIGAPYGPRKTWPIGGSSGAADDGSSRQPGADASDGDGGPAAGDDGVQPGSSSIDASGRGSRGPSADTSADDSGSVADTSVQRDSGGTVTTSRSDE